MTLVNKGKGSGKEKEKITVTVSTSDGAQKKITVDKMRFKEFIKKIEKKYGINIKEYSLAKNGEFILTDKNGEVEENPILKDGDLIRILQKGFAGA